MTSLSLEKATAKVVTYLCWWVNIGCNWLAYWGLWTNLTIEICARTLHWLWTNLTLNLELRWENGGLTMALLRNFQLTKPGQPPSGPAPSLYSRARAAVPRGAPRTIRGARRCGALCGLPRRCVARVPRKIWEKPWRQWWGGPNNRGEANIYGRFKGGYIDSTIIIYGRYYLWEI